MRVALGRRAFLVYEVFPKPVDGAASTRLALDLGDVDLAQQVGLDGDAHALEQFFGHR
jgi:hypothetical protein